MKPLNREILKLALPSILANITVPLVGMVDIAVAGHLNGMEGFTAAAFIGGISIGSLLFDLLYWNFGFLRAGTGGLTAQAFGAGDMRECGRIFARAVGLAMIVALVCIAIQWPFTKLALLAVKCSPEVRELALKYFFIRIWAAPATLSLMSFRGWFIGIQDSVSSMLVDLMVNVVNIAASILLSLGVGNWQGMGFAGVAAGTVVAQYSGLALAVIIVLTKYRMKVFHEMRLADYRSAFEGSELRSFLSMNADIFVRSLCFIAIYIGFTIISARYGDLMLASSTIMMKLLMIFSYFTDGFAYAGEALTGRFIGEKSLEMTRKTVKYVFVWSMSVVVLFIFAYWAGGLPMLKMMTSDAEVIEACRQFLPWLVLMPLIGCPCFTWDGIYLGATATKGVRNSMLAATAAFFAFWFIGEAVLLHGNAPTEPDALAGWQALAIHILMVAYFAHLVARTIVLTVRYRRDVLRSFR